MLSVPVNWTQSLMVCIENRPSLGNWGLRLRGFCAKACSVPFQRHCTHRLNTQALSREKAGEQQLDYGIFSLILTGFVEEGIESEIWSDGTNL